MQICRLVILDQQNLFLLISARITIYDIVISDQAEIDGDTAKLQTAIKSVNGQIKSTQQQLKDVDKLLKLDPENTELLEKQISDVTEFQDMEIAGKYSDEGFSGHLVIFA